MAIKYSENTSYNIGDTEVSSKAAIEALRKSNREGLNRMMSGANNSQPVKRVAPVISRATPFNSMPEEEREERTSSARLLANSGVSIGEALPPSYGLKSYEEVIGSEYGSFRSPSELPYAQKAGYLSPEQVNKDTLVFESPDSGGTYIKDSLTGKIVMTERPDFSFSQNELRRQGLDSRLYEVDHIIPLWAGGADTESNMEVLTKTRHDVKTLMQSVPLTLMSAGDISWEEALKMTANWKEYSDRRDVDMPELQENGLIDVESARRIAQQWKEDPKLNFREKIKKISGSTANKISMLAEVILPKEKGVSSAIVRESTKGLISGLVPMVGFASKEILSPAEYDDKASQRAANISYALGSIAGNIASFVTVYSGVVKMLGKMGVKWAAKEVGKKTLKKVAKEKAAMTVADEIANKGVLTAEMINRSKRLSRWASEVAPKAITLGAVSTAIGQARPMYETENKLTGEMEPQSREERAFYDFLYGAISPIGRVGYSAKAYAKVAMPAFIIGTAEGLSNNDSFSNAMSMALINTATIAGIHGAGHIGAAMKKGPFGRTFAPDKAINTADKHTEAFWAAKGKGEKGEQDINVWQPKDGTKGTAAEAVKAEAVNKKANEFAISSRRRWHEQMISDIRSGELTQADASKYGINLDVNFIRKNRKTFRVFKKANQIDEQNATFNEYFKWKSFKEGLSDQELNIMKSRVFATGKQLFYNGLAPTVRERRQAEDLISLTRAMFANIDPKDVSTPTKVKEINYSHFKKAPSKESMKWIDVRNISDEEKQIRIEKYGNDGPPPNGMALLTGVGVDERFKENTEILRKVMSSIKNGDLPDTPVIDIDTGLEVPNKKTVKVLMYHNKASEYGDDVIDVYVNTGKKMERVGSVGTKKSVETHNENIALSGREGLTARPLDTEINNSTIVNAMKNRNTDILEATMVINPPGGASKTDGGWFGGIILNDDVFDSNKISSLKTLARKDVIDNEKAVENVQSALSKKDDLLKSVDDAKEEVSLENSKELDNYIKEVVVDKDDLADFDFGPETPIEPVPAKGVKSKKIVSDDVSAKNEVINDEILIDQNKKVDVSDKELTKRKTQKEDDIKKFEEVYNRKEDSEKNKPSIKSNEVIPENKISPMDRAEEIDEKISARAFREFGEEGTIKGVEKDINQKVSKIPESDMTPERKAAIDDIKKVVSNEDFEVNTKKLVKKHKGDENAAFKDFMDDLDAKYKNSGIESPFNKNIKGSYSKKQAFKSFFKIKAQSAPSTSLLLSKKRDKVVSELISNPSRPKHLLDDSLEALNEKNKTNLSYVKAQIDSGVDNMDTYRLKSAFFSKGVVPFGYSGNKPGDFFGVTYDARVISKNKDGSLKNIKDGAEEFFNKIVREIGIDPKEVKMGTMNKRWKEILFSEYKPINNKNDKRRLLVADFGKYKTGEQVNDGASFQIISDMNKQKFEGGYMHKGDYRTSKSVIMFNGKKTDNLPNGELNVIKNQVFGIDADGPIAKKLEGLIRKQSGNKNYKLKEGDFITSFENVKLGKNILSSKSKGFHEGEFSMNSYRAKYDNPKNDDNVYKVSLYLLSFFGSDDGVNKAFSSMYSKPMKQYKAAQLELMNAKTAKEGKAILEKNKAIFKGALGENAYGKTKKMLDNNAWGEKGSDIWYELDGALSDGFRRMMLSGQFIKSSYSKFLPDLGLYKDSSGKRTFIPKGEAVISTKHWEKLGKPERIMVTRHPNTKRSGMLSLKVSPAEKHGINDLGDSIMANSDVGYKDLYFDFDGDSASIFKVGGEGGIPNKIADRLEAIYRKEGGKIPKEVQGMQNHDPIDITMENSLKIGEQSIKGGAAVGENTNMRMVIQGVIDNNETIGGWSLKDSSPEGVKKMLSYMEYMNNAATDSTKRKNLDMELTANEAENVMELLRNRFFNPPENLSKNKAVKEFGKRFNILNIPFKYAKLEKSIPTSGIRGKQSTLSDEFKTYAKEVTSKRQKLGPVDTIIKDFGDLPRYDKVDAKTQTRIHNNRMSSVDNAIKEGKVEMAPESDQKVKEIIDYFTVGKDDAGAKLEALKSDLSRKQRSEVISQKARDIRSIKKTDDIYDIEEAIEETTRGFREGFSEFFESRLPELTNAQKNTISHWLLKSDKANLANWGTAEKRFSGKDSFQVRLSSEINDAPEIAKIYYSAETDTVASPQSPKTAVSGVLTEKVISSPKTTKKVQAGEKSTLFDSSDKKLKIGSVANYKGGKYLVWGKTTAGAAKLITIHGKKYIGTPKTDKINVLGKFPTVKVSGKGYIVTDAGNVYSASSGSNIKSKDIKESVLSRFPNLLKKTAGKTSIVEKYSNLKKSI